MPTEPPQSRLLAARVHLENSDLHDHPVHGFLLRYAEQLDEALRDEDMDRVEKLLVLGPHPEGIDERT